VYDFKQTNSNKICWPQMKPAWNF